VRNLDTIDMTEAISNGVIVVDDDALIRAIVRSVLVSANQQVFPAVDGLEALHLARQFTARLVLLDIAMPRCNGLQACEAIRALPHYADVPIVMLTGHDEGPVRQAALRIGANDFITKPFRPDVLLTRLASFLVVPAELLPTDLGHDELLGGRARAWKKTQDSGLDSRDSAQFSGGREIKRAVVWERDKEDGPAPRDNAQLIEGREAIRIHRNAESRS
jgi:DNA-binding response OmpR family regulator